MYMSNALKDFLADVRIEAVKLQLQLAAPAREEKMRNDVLGNVFIEDFKAEILMDTIRKGIKEVERINAIVAMHEIYKRWDTARLEIQYKGWYGAERSAEAYGYVFLMRVARRFPELVPPRG